MMKVEDVGIFHQLREREKAIIATNPTLAKKITGRRHYDLPTKGISPVPRAPIRPAHVPGRRNARGRAVAIAMANRSAILRIIHSCARYGGVEVGVLLSESRTWPVVHVRHICMRLLAELLGLSSSTIAHALGMMDHTSILHGYRRAEHLIATNVHMAALYEAVKADVSGAR